MKHRSAILALATLLLFSAFALADDTKRQLEHSDYDRWNTIGLQRMSNDGKWVMYSVQSGKPDGGSTLFIRKNGGSKQYKIVRGASSRFTFDSRFALYQVNPDPELVKKLRKEKAKPEAMPQSRMELLELATGEIFSVPRVQSFKVPSENSEWLAYRLSKPFESKNVKEQSSDVSESYEVTPEGLKRPEKKLKLKKRRSETEETETKEEKKAPKKESKEEKKEDDKSDDKKAEPKDKSAGTVLVLRNIATGLERRFPNVKEFSFSKQGEALAFVTSIEVKKDDKPKKSEDKDKDETPHADGVHVFDLDKQEVVQIASGLGNYKDLNFNEDGSHLTFMTDRDDYAAKTSSMSLFHWKQGSKKPSLVAKEGSKGVPAEWWLAPNSNAYFSEDGQRLFFETAPIPEKVTEERANPDKKEEKEKEDKAKLDLWHWQDPLLQPQQLLQANREKNRTYIAVFDLKSKS